MSKTIKQHAPGQKRGSGAFSKKGGKGFQGQFFPVNPRVKEILAKVRIQKSENPHLVVFQTNTDLRSNNSILKVEAAKALFGQYRLAK